MVINPKQKLKNLHKFQDILNSYRPSRGSIDLLKRNPPVFLVGPTAAGRNTLINLLVDTGRYHPIVSDTTRSKRSNNGMLEQHGREYWFVSEDEFLGGLEQGRYLEAAIIHRQQVSGVSVAELEKASTTDSIPVNEIEIDGAKKIHSYSQDVLFIFLLPPTFEVWMDRLRSRGDIDEDELKRRLKSAINEITTALEVDYFQFVINTEIHVATVAVDELANGRQPDLDKQQKGRDHAEQLAIDVQLYLDNF